jgi:hypothetical protein
MDKIFRAILRAKSLVKAITGQRAISFWKEYPFSPTFAAEQLIEGNEIVPFFFSQI